MIALTGLTFRYEQSETIIDSLDWEFDQGTVTAVTGPSGCGKSTLLYLVGLLLTPRSGSIRVGNVDVGLWSDSKRSRFRASRVGFVFQDAALDASRTIMDNIIESSVYNGMPRRQALAEARELMERFGVALRHDQKPGQVSGGQAQRIALCRGLLARPDIVLADEPTGNLDVNTAHMVIQALVDLARLDGRTVIIATHDPSIVSTCDRVLEL